MPKFLSSVHFLITVKVTISGPGIFCGPICGSFVGLYKCYVAIFPWHRGSPKVHLLHHVWYLSRYGDFMSKNVKTRYDVTPLNHFSQRDTVVSITKPVLLYGITSHVKEDLLFEPEWTNNTDTSIVQYAGVVLFLNSPFFPPRIYIWDGKKRKVQELHYTRVIQEGKVHELICSWLQVDQTLHLHDKTDNV